MLLMALAALALSAMSALAKFAAASLPSTEVVFYRSLVATGILLGIHLGLGARRGALAGQPANRPWLVARGLLGALGLMCFFYALSGLSVADAMLLNLCSPIWVLFLAGPLLGERTRAMQWALVPPTLAGAVLVIRPDLAVSNWYGLAGLASSVLASGALVCVRRITRAEPAHVVVMYFSIASVLVSAPFVLPELHSPDAWTWLALVGVAVFSVIFQLLMTAAFRFSTAGQGAMVLYLGPVLAVAWDALLFDHLPGWTSLAGATLIIGSLIGLHYAGRRAVG